MISDQLGMDQNWGTKGPTALVIILPCINLEGSCAIIVSVC